MTTIKFPTRQRWADAVWPEKGERTIVAAHEGGKFAEAIQAVLDNPDDIFMFAVEDFDYFNKEIPSLWRRPSVQNGGIPPNVWVGASFTTNQELKERAPRLLRIRAKVLFLMAQRGHDEPELFDFFEPWRCMNCGRRGFTEWPAFCPSGVLCEEEDLIMPQIGWLLDLDRHEDSVLDQVCAGMRVALWDGIKREVPF